MRVLQICQRPQRRGAEVFAHQISGEFRRQGHDVRIVYLYPHAGEGSLPIGPQDRVLGGDEHHVLETLIGFRPSLLRRLTEVIRDVDPDVTQLNGARTLKYGVLSRRLMAAPVGSLVYRNIGVPQDWVQGFRRQAFYRMVSRGIDGVVAITNGSVQALRAYYPEPMPLAVVSNSVDPSALEPQRDRSTVREDASTPETSPVALFVGSLSAEKRVGRLIDAVDRVRRQGTDLLLWVVGEGPCREALETQVERLELDHAVRFFGAQSDVASFYGAADLLALVSETEGIPAVVLEAGLMGLPVVATRVGGVHECVEDGQTGLLVARDDEDELADVLLRLARDPGLRTRLGQRARARISERHSVERIALEFTDFYRRVGSARDEDRA